MCLKPQQKQICSQFSQADVLTNIHTDILTIQNIRYTIFLVRNIFMFSFGCTFTFTFSILVLATVGMKQFPQQPSKNWGQGFQLAEKDGLHQISPQGFVLSVCDKEHVYWKNQQTLVPFQRFVFSSYMTKKYVKKYGTLSGSECINALEV